MEPTNGTRWERHDAPLGTLVYRAGLLSKDKLEAALEEGQRSGRRLGEILLENGWIDEKDLARLLAGQKGLQFVSLHGRGYEVQAARLLPERVCRYHNAMPIELSGETVLVAIADPTDDSANDEIRDELGREVNLVVATASEIRSALDAVFGAAQAPKLEVAGETVAGDLGLRIAAPVADPENEPEAGDGDGDGDGDEPALEAVPEADATTTDEAAAEEPDAGAEEPTIERDADAHLSVAFHAAPATQPERDGEPAAAPEPEPARDDAFRLVINVDGEEAIDLAHFADEAEAVAAARELVAGIAKDGDWPHVGTRFVPPHRILSVEIREKARHTGSRERAEWGARASGS